MILEVSHIDTYYGASHILQAVSLSVQEGEIVALLGRNGVGKTTTLRSIIGLSPPSRGSIRFQGREICGPPPYEIASLGVAYVPDDYRIFPDLTAEENLEIARRLSPRKGHWNRDRVVELFPALGDRLGSRGINLSGGEKKMLAVGRALMANPFLMLLDEPSEGLAPLVVANLIEVLGKIRAQGVTILLADQNLKFCRKVCNRGYILEKGRVQHEGEMEAIWNNEEIIRKYLVV
ncbi:MAG TPA: ABC transporter ATP-binding protein [Candidatus Deferrimicrobiaceae bacterium]|nr:ABC transporter ATP-binding protein [Candidatus Deferrimicrobiaceae bacterium]